MDMMLKWIGGATLVLVAGFAGLFLNGSLEAEGEAPRSTPATAAVASESGEPALDPLGALAAKALADQQRLYTVRRVLPIDGPIKYGEWHWDDEGVPEGPLLVTVDLEARVISIFRGGYEIGAAAVMLGTDDYPTPTGKFPILWKQRHNVSEKYGNAPMPWSMFLTRDGIAIHGGSEVENGYASHGCVGVPDEIASRLFDIAKEGDMVVITDGETLQLGDSIV
ncbi:L,D-transpeptidase family protein [Qipengyuania sp. XHP0207]|uniref:L,D-transpeptidase family protein n=1 Tax=Qipengyuania sp. XHP0207 TaxID=3038078 RepID=UPI00241DBE44|nr:L,D-transpeptidase family protein [Qipengyuania sp. XHP0207]MDG5749197.1 L,D-transpeptidase family protein [Qipengyuania sp. XHP0207]